MKKKCVEHYTDGRNAWRFGFLGFFLERRGFIIAVLASLVGGGAISWYGLFTSVFGGVQRCELVTREVVLPLWVMCLAVFSCIALASLLSLVVLRRRSMRSLALKAELHDLAELLRDKAVWACKLAQDTSTKNQDRSREEFIRYCNDLCDQIAKYFRILIGDTTIECSIRISDHDESDHLKKDVNYHTVGHSRNLRHRLETSQPISTDTGVAAVFLDLDAARNLETKSGAKKKHGVLVYYDLNKAAQTDPPLYAMTDNDRKHPDDIKTFMVAPINGWSGRSKEMLGLLYVTSKTNPFSRVCIDPLRMVADMLGENVSRVVDCLFDRRKMRFQKEKR